MTKKSKYFDVILSSLFVAIISIPLIFAIFGINKPSVDEFKLLEKRFPASFPKISPLNLFSKKSLHQFERWYGDWFGFRTVLINLDREILSAMKVSFRPDNVIFGKRDWLFIGNSYQKTLDRNTGIFEPSEKVIKNFLSARLTQKTWLNRRGIFYIVVLVPDKANIYPEHLPSWIRIRETQNMFDIITSRASKYNLPVINLKQDLLDAKKKYKDLLYYKADTHWSELGAYIGYRNIISGLENYLGPLQVLHLKNYSKENRSRNDLDIMLGVERNRFQYQLEFEEPFHPITVKDLNDNPVEMSPWDTVNVQLIRNIKNSKALNQQRILFLRDSFSINLSPMLNQTFSEAIYADYLLPEGEEMTKLVKKYKPRIVVHEIIQRWLVLQMDVQDSWFSR